MSQSEIYKILKESKKPMTSKEIAEMLGIQTNKVSRQVSKIGRYYQNIIKKELWLPNKNGQLYRYVSYQMIEG